MNPESCSLFDKCECPLCPLVSDSNQIWYSEDEICKNPEFELITRSMKKLKRKAAPGYFTLEMLRREFIVRKGTEGIDPDLSNSTEDPVSEHLRRESIWLKRHPEISKERKERMRELGLKSVASIQKPLSHPSISEIVNPKGVTTRLNPETPQKLGQNGGLRK